MHAGGRASLWAPFEEAVLDCLVLSQAGLKCSGFGGVGSCTEGLTSVLAFLFLFEGFAAALAAACLTLVAVAIAHLTKALAAESALEAANAEVRADVVLHVAQLVGASRAQLAGEGLPHAARLFAQLFALCKKARNFFMLFTIALVACEAENLCLIEALGHGQFGRLSKEQIVARTRAIRLGDAHRR